MYQFQKKFHYEFKFESSIFNQFDFQKLVKMTLQRSMHLLKAHPGIKHASICSIVVPAVAAGYCLMHAAKEPLNLRKLQIIGHKKD